jgi:hypothetical protein
MMSATRKPTEREKQKFLEYVKSRSLEYQQNPQLQGASGSEGDFDLEKLVDYMVDDLVEKTGRKKSRFIFRDYISSIAILNYEKSLNEEEKTELKESLEKSKQEKNENYMYDFIIESLLQEKNTKLFFGGLVFGYAKLAYKLKVEPEYAYMSVLEVFEMLTA